MDLSRCSMKKIRELIVFTAFLVVALWKFDVVIEVLKSIWKIVFPFALGGAIAFVINVPMSFLEKKMLGKIKENNNIVGVVIFKIKIVREHINLIDRKVIWINELVVDEKLRGKGIGTKLFNETKKYAKNNKCDAVELNCWEFNEKALRFYERCGMNTQRRIMDLKINIYE